MDTLNLSNEVKFSETSRFKDRVTFEEFVGYYVNHRPVYSVSVDDLDAAFKVDCIQFETTFFTGTGQGGAWWSGHSRIPYSAPF